MDIEKILYQEEFNMINNDLKKKLIVLDKNLSGKNEMEKMKYLVDFYNDNLKNINLSPQEEKAMFFAISNSLNSGDRQQFENMYKILQKHKNS